MKVTKSNLLVSPLSIWGWLFKPEETEQALRSSRLRADEALERQKLEERLGEIQRNDRCVWRAVRLMIFLTALAVVGVGYTTVLIPDSAWPQTMRQFLMLLPIKATCVLGLASLSCAFAFSALGIIYRRELAGLRLEFRRLADEITQPEELRIIPLPVASGAESSSTENAWRQEPPFVKEAA